MNNYVIVALLAVFIVAGTVTADQLTDNQNTTIDNNSANITTDNNTNPVNDNSSMDDNKSSHTSSDSSYANISDPEVPYGLQTRPASQHPDTTTTKNDPQTTSIVKYPTHSVPNLDPS